jgi:hypothetical protein
MSKQIFSEYIRARINDEPKPLSDEMRAAAEKMILSPVAASKDQRYAPHFKRAIQIAARCNFEIDPESKDKISLFKLDAAMKAAGVDLGSRFEGKAILAQAGLL